MKLSQHRILTTHVGSLPRSEGRVGGAYEEVSGATGVPRARGEGLRAPRGHASIQRRVGRASSS